MSNEFVQASANFLTESWYKENAGTPQYQDAKYLEQAFDDIVEYCLENGLDIEESIEIASEIIEEDGIEDFYEEIVNEASAVQRSRDLARQRSQQAQQAQQANQARQANRALQGGKAVNITGTGMLGSQYLQGTARLNSGATQRLGRSVLNVTPTTITGRSGRSNLSLDPKIRLGGQDYYKSQLGGKDVYVSRPKTSTTPTRGTTPTPTRGTTPTPTRGATPTAPTAGRSPLAPSTTASALTRTSTASTSPIVPTAPTPPSTPMAKLGQGSGDSIFSREGGRQEYERRMKQAIRTGTKYQAPGTGDVTNTIA